MRPSESEHLLEHGRIRRRVIGLLGVGAVGASGTGLWRVVFGGDRESSGAVADTTEAMTQPLLESSTTFSTGPDHKSTEPATANEPPPSLQETSTTSVMNDGVLVDVVSRDGWGAVPAGDGMVEHVPVRLTLHHTALEQTDLSQGPARVRQHQTHHQSLGWPDLAYHFVVDRAGVAYEGRAVQFRGDTGTEYDPDGHFLVCMEGNFDVQEPSPEQLETMIRLFAWAADEFAIDPATIAGHNAYAATSCPGAATELLLPILADRIVATPPVLLSIVGG